LGKGGPIRGKKERLVGEKGHRAGVGVSSGFGDFDEKGKGRVLKRGKGGGYGRRSSTQKKKPLESGDSLTPPKRKLEKPKGKSFSTVL